jgi:hypothetical protein
MKFQIPLFLPPFSFSQNLDPRPRIKAIIGYCNQNPSKLCKFFGGYTLYSYPQNLSCLGGQKPKPHYSFWHDWVLKHQSSTFWMFDQSVHIPTWWFHSFRWDKYESKQLYWIEEELEAEWEKTTAKSRRSEAEYQSLTSASSAFESSLAPLGFDAAGSEGPEVKIMKDIWYTKQ